MKYRAYVRVIGTRQVVEQFCQEAAWQNAKVRGPKGANADASDKWSWRTEEVVCPNEDVDEFLGLIASLLTRCMELAPRICAFRPRLGYASLVVVCEYMDGETPSGLYLDEATVARMAAMRLDLDFDTSRVGGSSEASRDPQG